MNQANKKFVNIKIEDSDAIELRRLILGGEVGSIKVLQILKRYKDLRMSELDLKNEFDKKLKDMRTSLNSIQLLIPKVSEEKEKVIIKEEKISSKKETKKLELGGKEAYNLEKELEEIKRKLNSLEAGQFIS